MLASDFIDIYRLISSFHGSVPDNCEVRQAGELKGRAIIATRHIAKGQLIIREKPLLAYAVSERESNDVSIVKAWCRLRPRQKYLYNILTTGGATNQHRIQDVVNKTHITHLSEDDIHAIASRTYATQYGTGTYEYGTDSEDEFSIEKEDKREVTCVVGWWGSFMNHSCGPNAGYEWDSRGHNLEFRSHRDIKANEEITVSYIHTTRKSLEARRKELMRTWGFICQCPVCRREEARAAIAGRLRGK